MVVRVAQGEGVLSDQSIHPALRPLLDGTIHFDRPQHIRGVEAARGP
jgi:hypothetical protein